VSTPPIATAASLSFSACQARPTPVRSTAVTTVPSIAWATTFTPLLPDIIGGLRLSARHNA
jgi:hypothetical protein